MEMRNGLKNMASNSVKACQEKGERATIFGAMNVEEIPASERTVERLTDEAQILIAAGTETTARDLVVWTYSLCLQHDVLHRLRKELKQLGSDRPTWTELESLPYLGGDQRGSSHVNWIDYPPAERVAPDEDLVHNDWVIPRGTPISSSSYLITMNPDLFPEPTTFNPDRWLKAAENGENLGQFITNFTKGSRSCIGIKYDPG
ncbi:cytochrome P450 [Aspergillus ibericus CBS 121593]|uniref:Cytochrome P450 n=1 Tax=Aspergillus ibericus CBS 121593 TaxID=1448316 RepID=A0A395H048_9EURO|nr:cytochrome P450 [Aspergillus ibericus CBS 121593]RAL01217.1 cytochrome P450 [Aspergillus ibericus CBS 121593]